MSLLFDQLYNEAMRRDIEVAKYAGRLMNAIGCTAGEARRHAEAFNAMFNDFEHDLIKTAKRNRMRVRNWRSPPPYLHIMQIALIGELPNATMLPDEEDP